MQSLYLRLATVWCFVAAFVVVHHGRGATWK